jgi:hypothetical protein
LSIGLGVRTYSRTAQSQFPGDRVEALASLVDCASCNMQDRNHAVWALGKLDDPRALPILEKYYTGKECNHWRDICRETLKIAFRHLRHQDNNRFESFLMRWMLPEES